MIVRPATGVVQLITQPDHAQLARRIMERCRALADHPRRDAILHAIAEHDNGWNEEDAAPFVTPAGRVADFIGVPVEVRQRVWPRGVGRLANPWAAALVAHHAVTVYERYRPDPQWSSFFAQMEAMRDARVREHGLSFADLAADYPFVRLGDLASLAFCTASTDEQGFGAWAVKLSGQRVTVTPGSFDGVVIEIEVAARELAARPYDTHQDLRSALRTAPVRLLHGEVA